MIQPKFFYRKFDELLRKIDFVEADRNFVFAILEEFHKKFGESLRLGSWGIFERRQDDFVSIDRGETTLPQILSVEAEVVERVLKHRCYIFDDSDLRFASYGSPEDKSPEAALLLRSRKKQWIVVFQLRDGWTRDEVMFCINAVRTALNYRFLAEAAETDWEQATQIQVSLLPQHAPQIEGLQISGRSQPAQYVGGDLFDYYEFEGRGFGVSIGDASGHGLPAALLVRDLVTGLRMGLAQERNMTLTIETINEVLYRATFSSRFSSLFYGEIAKDGRMIYVNAGHPSPLLVNDGSVTELKSTGTILGALPKLSLQQDRAQLQPGGVLVLYTDGINERRDDKNRMFKISRLKDLVRMNRKKTAQEILQIIYDAAFEFGNRANWEDDATVVVIKRTETLANY